MPVLRITVVDPPSEFAEYEHIALLLQTPTGFAGPVAQEDNALVFERPFEFKADRSGRPQPSGPAIQRESDGRRFVYLSWQGTQGGITNMFRRLKVYFDTAPGYPEPQDEYRVRVRGTDRRGGPACATAVVLTE